ncbi:unnamed protein product [Cyprideis torosa]|uniref:Uncharacterized protein n=1 Tax=Cyprideis torosa TaxID=163714 RepID=A0A7R8WX57_9CRUS|nr:unnamed protein product [Cyprideis torosa]CAG0907688.1 unnamed protein product [Cyprideis torosa]
MLTKDRGRKINVLLPASDPRSALQAMQQGMKPASVIQQLQGAKKRASDRRCWDIVKAFAAMNLGAFSIASKKLSRRRRIHDSFHPDKRGTSKLNLSLNEFQLAASTIG